MNTSELFKINLRDVGKGLFSAVVGATLVAAFGVLQAVFNTPGFDVFLVDWAVLFHNLVNAGISGGITAFMGYVGTHFFSNPEGKVLGKL